MDIKINFKLFFSLYWWLVVTEAVIKKWPSRFPRCYRDDPNINKCMLEATKTMKPFLLQGLPEFNIPSISPFFIPEVLVEQGTDTLNYKVVFKNVTIMGFDSYEFEKFDFDVENLSFDAALNMSSINVTSYFTVNGKILTIPIAGDGKVSSFIGHSSGTFRSTAKMVTKDSKIYLETQKLTIKLNIGKIIDYQLGGLFDQNKVLAEAAYKIIDDNKEILVEEVKPAIEEVMERIVEDLIEKSLGKLPYDEVFPLRNNA